ncbi:amidohydrolase family protein [Membranihabitans maritimus]|uniref:amidohydrolase family protein n=1 Tax=Membranihabitans maritimus TaxID=2904244 RepID=UPI001F461F3E|nr:amidohydrolase family protein [Membranihabitans maritimus]
MKFLSRRKFLTNTSLASAGLIFYPDLSGSTERGSQEGEYNMLGKVGNYRKIDSYCTADPQMDMVDKLGIEKMFVGKPMAWKEWTPEQFIAANNEILGLMKKYPGKVVGQISVNPQYGKESLEEINRCVGEGMVGTRLYYQVKINDPLYYPVIEKLIDLKMIIFIHGEAQIGVGGYKMQYDVGRPPNISRPEDFVEAAERYPEAMFQFAHIGGGGDWEYMCKSFREFPNIYVDAGGSNNEENMIDFAVECLGEDRIFFGTDNSYFQGVGKILSSNLTERQKQKIFFDNYNSILKKGGYHVN